MPSATHWRTRSRRSTQPCCVACPTRACCSTWPASSLPSAPPSGALQRPDPRRWTCGTSAAASATALAAGATTPSTSRNWRLSLATRVLAARARQQQQAVAAAGWTHATWRARSSSGSGRRPCSAVQLQQRRMRSVLGRPAAMHHLACSLHHHHHHRRRRLRRQPQLQVQHQVAASWWCPSRAAPFPGAP